MTQYDNPPATKGGALEVKVRHVATVIQIGTDHGYHHFLQRKLIYRPFGPGHSPRFDYTLKCAKPK